MKMLITKVVLAASVALGTLMAAQAADAAQRYNGGQAYDAQANPNYRFGPRVTVQPGDVVSGNRSAATPIRSFAISSCANTIRDARIDLTAVRKGPASCRAFVRPALSLPVAIFASS